MRIDLVSEHANPLAVLGSVDAGGQNVHVAELARTLGALGHSVVVHSRRDDPTVARRVLLAPNVIVDHVDAGPPIPLSKDALLQHVPEFARVLRERWRSDRPDVVHSHFWMSGLAALAAAHPMLIPVAHTFHALGIEKRRHQGAADTSPFERVELEGWIARSADAVIATTEAERNELVGGAGAHATAIHVVPCGVDLDHFDPRGPVRPRRGERLRVVTLSRLVERKGIGNVIEAVAQLVRDGLDVELLVAGGPPGALLDDDAEAARFRLAAARAGIGDRVEMLGAIDRAEAPALLRSADVVACCPWYEPFGLVAIEAMACERPVVVSAVGGLAETVVDGITGLHVPARDPGAIAWALRTLLQDASLRRRFGLAGRARSMRYSWRRVGTQTASVLAALDRSAAEPVSARVSTADPR